MGSAQPDLAAGIEVDELKDGDILRGRVGEDSVLLIRQKDKFFAVSGNCSHYGAPLNEGAIVGKEIRCPWHHAAFDLETGEATRAPALNPIGCWNVELRQNKVHVTSKKTEPKNRTRETAAQNIVIVGAGAAGNAAAEMLRREGFQQEIILIGAEPHTPYDRPNLSKDYLAGTAPEEWIPLRGLDFYKEKNITLKLGSRAVKFDAKRCEITLASGETIGFDQCLIATGSLPNRLPVPGADHEHVLYLRSLDDSRAIVDRAKTAKTAVVIGSGFIGLETAAALKSRGLDVLIVTNDELPMQRLLGKPLAEFLLTIYRENGISFHGGRSIKAIEKNAVHLDNGLAAKADLVVVGIGVKPAVGLLEASGLAHQGQIDVNEFLETSIPGIYVAGDIARFPDFRNGERIRLEHWTTSQRQGQIAALNMLGKKTPFRTAPFFWSQHFDVTLSYVGHANTWDEIHIDGSLSSKEATVAYLHQGQIKALLTIGRDKISLAAEEAMEQGDQTLLRRLAGIA